MKECKVGDEMTRLISLANGVAEEWMAQLWQTAMTASTKSGYKMTVSVK